jgi:hypothetical protein
MADTPELQMALKFKLDSLDGLEEGLKSLYTKGDDGKYTLQLEDDQAKSTMQKLRQERDEMAKALKDREKAEADAKAAKEREELERKGEYEKLKASLEADNNSSKAKLEALETKIRNSARDRAAMEAIQAAKGIPKALLPHITPNLEVIPDGDDFKVVVKGNPGQKLTDYVSSLKAEMAWGFEGSGASGGGAAQGGMSMGGTKPWGQMNLDERTALYKTNPSQAKALQAGV